MPGALVGGLGFILPGLAMIIALAALFLAGSPPEVILGAGAGAGAAVAAVAVHAGTGLIPASRSRQAGGGGPRWIAYALAGALAAALVGPWLVAVLLGCGLVEATLRRARPRGPVGPACTSGPRSFRSPPPPGASARWPGRR